MSKYILENIQKIGTYNPPLDNRHTYAGALLDFNERTIPVCENVKQAIINFVQNGQINLYPEYANLQTKIADYASVSPEQVMITNGSDQGIELIFRSCTAAKSKVIIPSPSFPIYYQYAKVLDNQIITPQYSAEKMDFPFQEVLNLIAPDVKLLIICNPNNPTGTTLTLTQLEPILDKAKQNDVVVLLDEAYYEFSQITGTNLLNKYPNLVITRTFSKAFGLCALRIGYLIASPEIINNLLKVRGPYDINMVAAIAASTSLDNLQDISSYINLVMQKAKPMVEQFFQEQGITYFASQANYLLFTIPNPEIIYQKMAEQGFRLRPQKNPAISHCLRLTIGTPEQMEQFIKVFKKEI